MKLADVLLLIEQELQQQANAPQKVVEFPAQNFAVSLIKAQKKLIFSPIEGDASASIRSMINQMKTQGFKVSALHQKGMGTFEVDLDKTENFDLVVDYLKQQLDNSPL